MRGPRLLGRLRARAPVGAGLALGLAAGWGASSHSGAEARTGEARPLDESELRARLAPRVRDGLRDSIGGTPLIELRSVSEATGCRVMAKAEFANPGGSVKDRPALAIIEAAERDGLLPRGGGGVVVEATGGNTGIGMALVANAKGHRCVLVMPATISAEKIAMMRAFGAEVVLQPAVPFSDPRHYFHTARRLAEAAQAAWSSSEAALGPGTPLDLKAVLHADAARLALAPAPPTPVVAVSAKPVPEGAVGVVGGRVILGNQFENEANLRAHYEGTGPEIWLQSGHRVDAVVMACGTGGTLAGVSRFLREQNPALQVFLIDPPGSALASAVESGCASPSPGSSVVEGIGINRVTSNFAQALPLDGAFRGSDREAVEMAHYLLRHEGLFVGPSAALNVVGAVKVARRLARTSPSSSSSSSSTLASSSASSLADEDGRPVIVTVLCDSGERYRSKIYDAEFLRARDLEPRASVLERRGDLSFVQ